MHPMREQSVFKPPKEIIGRVGDPTKVPHPLPRSFQPRTHLRLMLPCLHTPRRVMETGREKLGCGPEPRCRAVVYSYSGRSVAARGDTLARAIRRKQRPGALCATNVHPPANPSGKGWHQIPLARTGPRFARREPPPDDAPCPAGEGRRGGLKRRWESGELMGGADLANLGHLGNVWPVTLRLLRNPGRWAVWGNKR